MLEWANIYLSMSGELATATANSYFTVVFGLVIMLLAVIVAKVNSKRRRQNGLSTGVAVLPMVLVFIIGAGYSPYGFVQANAKPLALDARFVACESGGHGAMRMLLEIRKSRNISADGVRSRASLLGFHSVSTSKAMCQALSKDAVKTFVCVPGVKCIGWVEEGRVVMGAVDKMKPL